MTKKLKMLIAAVLVMTALLGTSVTAQAEERVNGCLNSPGDSPLCTYGGGGLASGPDGTGGYNGPNLPHNGGSSNSSNDQSSFTPPPCAPLCGPQPSNGASDNSSM